METNFVTPVTIRAASICIFSKSFASYTVQFSQTISEYSITTLLKEK